MNCLCAEVTEGCLRWPGQREKPPRDPAKPRAYADMTGLTPKERFVNHKAAWVVKRYGVRLLPELYAHFNLTPFESAARMETDLTEDLRGRVHGGGRASSGLAVGRQARAGSDDATVDPRFRCNYRELPTAVPHFKLGASQNTMKRPWRWVAILVAAPVGAVAGLFVGYTGGGVLLKLQGLDHSHGEAWTAAGLAVLGSVVCVTLFPMATWFFTREKMELKGPLRWAAILGTAPVGAVAGFFCGYAVTLAVLKLQGSRGWQDDLVTLTAFAGFGSVLCAILFSIEIWFLTRAKRK
jgi:hypothetical protein